MKTMISVSLKGIAPYTLAFCKSLHKSKASPFSKPAYRAAVKNWRFVETTASTVERHIAIYSILLVDVFGRAVQLQVAEEDWYISQNLLYYTNFLALLLFTRRSVY